MIIKKTYIRGLWEIFTPQYQDNRGYLFESYVSDKYEFPEFVHEMVSVSRRNVIRGLHYQIGNDAQGKLCQVLNGCVLDVVVDIRPESKTFGQYFSTFLGETEFIGDTAMTKQLWVSPGLAHGFRALHDHTIFHYKCTHERVIESERTLLYNDSELNISWNIGNKDDISDVILSDKDKNGHLFKEL